MEQQVEPRGEEVVLSTNFEAAEETPAAAIQEDCYEDEEVPQPPTNDIDRPVNNIHTDTLVTKLRHEAVAIELADLLEVNADQMHTSERYETFAQNTFFGNDPIELLMRNLDAAGAHRSCEHTHNLFRKTIISIESCEAAQAEPLEASTFPSATTALAVLEADDNSDDEVMQQWRSPIPPRRLLRRHNADI